MRASKLRLVPDRAARDRRRRRCPGHPMVTRIRRMVLTGEQVAAAMAILRIGRRELAALAQLSPKTVERLEDTNGPLSAAFPEAHALRDALERAGVAFMASGEDGSEGPGVIDNADLNGSNDG